MGHIDGPDAGISVDEFGGCQANGGCLSSPGTDTAVGVGWIIL